MMSSNPEHKTTNLAKAIFADLYETLQRRDDAMKKFKEILEQTMLFGLVKQYHKGSSGKGTIDWEGLLDDVHGAMVTDQLEASDDEEEGIAEGFGAMAM